YPMNRMLPASMRGGPHKVVRDPVLELKRTTQLSGAQRQAACSKKSRQHESKESAEPVQCAEAAPMFDSWGFRHLYNLLSPAGIPGKVCPNS
ncbi:hypothetical protein, partial [Anaerotruncus rubiinfantis]|uniref:hypothetical protein n=1 Tax=Anaerotruncus rubiinfantis TaxID=1720200 RepID=UPI001A9AE182